MLQNVTRLNISSSLKIFLCIEIILQGCDTAINHTNLRQFFLEFSTQIEER